MATESVLIIGAGQISAFADTPGDKNTLSHAHGIFQNPALKLAGFVDLDLNKAQQATERWGGQAFNDTIEALTLTKPSVVVIATHDESHYSLLIQIANLKELTQPFLKLVIVEKPLTLHSNEAQEIASLYQSLALPLLVNYSRRFLPGIQALRHRTLSGEFGALLSGNAYYGKGLLHIGSHMLDCIQFLTGQIQSSMGLSSIEDFTKVDPSISGILHSESGAFISLHAIDCRLYTHFELDLLFEFKRVRLLEFGSLLEEANVEKHADFKGYRHLKTHVQQKTDLSHSMRFLYRSVTKFLQDGEAFPITPSEACQTIAICEQLRATLPQFQAQASYDVISISP